MAVKLSVGLQKKLGLPGYSSIGASCHVEFEVDSSMIESNLDGFHNKVNGAFAACQQAVNEQLAHQQGAVPKINGHSRPQLNGHTNGQPDRQMQGRATQSQLRTIFAMARNKRLDPQKLVHERFDRYVPEDLTIKEASRLIDELKDGTLSDRN